MTAQRPPPNLAPNYEAYEGQDIRYSAYTLGIYSRHHRGWLPYPRLRASTWKDKRMASGKVKWFDNKRGFGFICQESGRDVFVHHTSILGNGYKTLEEGETVNFDLVQSDKGPKAQNVQRAQP